MLRAPAWLLILVLANVLFVLGSLAVGFELTRPAEELPSGELRLPPVRAPVPPIANGADLVAAAAWGVPPEMYEGYDPPGRRELDRCAASLENLRTARGQGFARGDRSPEEIREAARLLAAAVRVELAEGHPDAAAGRLHDGLSFAVRAMWDPRDTFLGFSLVNLLMEAWGEDPSALAQVSTPILQDLQEGLEAACARRTSVEQAHLGSFEEAEFLPGLRDQADRARRCAVLSRMEPLRRRDFAQLRELHLRSRQTWDLEDPKAWLTLLLRREEFLAGVAASAVDPVSWAPQRLAAEFHLDALRVQVAAELSRRGVRSELPVPADPFAPGRRLGVAGDRVWSVGPDGLDGGGAHPIPPDTISARSRGDLVAP